MSEINLPPFYKGQRVVNVKRIIHARIKKGTEFIVKDLLQCKCGEWAVDVGVKLKGEFEISCVCEAVLSERIVWLQHSLFRPVQENFQSISLEKVLETETPLISVN